MASSAVRTWVAQDDEDTLLLAGVSTGELRSGVVILNDSADILYIGLGDQPVADDDFTYKVAAGGVMDATFLNWDGEIRGVWAAAGAGTAVITAIS